MRNETKGVVIGATFFIIAGVISVVMAVGFPEISSAWGFLVGAILAVPVVCWYQIWRD